MTEPLCHKCGQPMLLYRSFNSDHMIHRTFFCACQSPLTWHNELTKRTDGLTEVIDNE